MNTEGTPVYSVSFSKDLYWSFNSNSLHIVQSSMDFAYLHKNYDFSASGEYFSKIRMLRAGKLMLSPFLEH